MAAAGNGHKEVLQFLQPPRRVVSLVPSLTESMFDLGFGPAVIGITDYCVYPEGALGDLPRLGGTKDPDVQAIIDLEPDLVLANWEENTRQTVEALEAADISVWVTFPRSVSGALEVLWKLAELFRSQTAMAILTTLEVTLDWARSAAMEAKMRSYFCPIWHDRLENGEPWWMTFNQGTYPSDLLEILGYRNVFAKRQRHYPLLADLGSEVRQQPGGRDQRYPRVSLAEICQAQPEIILLPDEPFAFNETHRRMLETLLAKTPAIRHNRISLLPGSIITWHGTRLAYALRELPTLLDSLK